MNKKLDCLAEIVAKANDLFYSRHKNVDTLMGIMDKALRTQGMQADAITIDCVTPTPNEKARKVVFLLHDAKPDKVDIALGNKNGDIFSSSEYQLSEISAQVVLGILEMNFIAQATNQTS